jgi:hypothetical protein
MDGDGVGEAVMAVRYSSFLVRFYLLERGERVEIEHVQTGAKTRESSIEAAAAWMRAQTETDPDARAPPETRGAGARGNYHLNTTKP